MDHLLTLELKAQPVEPVQEDSVGAKLLREAQLFAAGFGGAGKAARESIEPENLPSTIFKLGVSAAFGLGLAYLSRGAGLRQLTGQVFGTAMTISFTKDVLARADRVCAAAQDTWHSNRNWNHNVAVMEDTLGRFTFDTALMTVGGLGGTRAYGLTFRKPGLVRPEAAASTGNLEVKPLSAQQSSSGIPPESLEVIRIGDLVRPTLKPGHRGVAIELHPVETPIGQVLSRYSQSVVRLEAPNAANAKVRDIGTGFLVDKEGTVVTCFHVVQNSNGQAIVHFNGRTFQAKVRSVDKSNDLAVLQVEAFKGEPSITPLKLSESPRSLTAQAETVALGYANASPELHVSPGKVTKTDFWLSWTRAQRPVWEDPQGKLIQLLSRTETGCSGGPVLCLATQEVVGVTSMGTSSTSFARRAADVAALLKQPAGYVKSFKPE